MVATDEITRRVLGRDTILILAAPEQGTCQSGNKAVAASLGFWFTGLLLPGRAFLAGWLARVGSCTGSSYPALSVHHARHHARALWCRRCEDGTSVPVRALLLVAELVVVRPESATTVVAGVWLFSCRQGGQVRNNEHSP